MIERIKVLMILQLSNKMALKIDNKQRLAANIALRLLVIALISVAMVVVLNVLNNILGIIVNAYFVVFILMVTQLFAIISATVGLMTDLYENRENTLLHSYPVKNDEVFLSKMLVYYLHEIVKNSFLIVPLLIGFGWTNQLSIYYYLNIVPMIFIIPAIAVLVAALLSVPLAMLRHFLSDKNILTLIVALLVIGLMFWLVMRVVGNIPTPIRITQLYSQFTRSINRFMQNAASYGLVYTAIGLLLYGIGIVRNYAIVLGSLIILLAAVVFVSRPLYFKLASRSMEHTVEKVHKSKKGTSKNLFVTFLLKEWRIARRSINQLLNDYTILIALPFFMYMLNYIFTNMHLNSTGNQLVLVFNIIIALLLVTASNTASASSITTEGTEFVIMKTAPSETRTMAWAKIAFNLLFSTGIILISFLLFQIALPSFSATHRWLIFLLVITLNAGHILWSFQIDLLNPKLSDYAATGSLSGNPNIAKSIAGGFALSLVFGTVAALAFLTTASSLAWAVLFLLAVPFVLLRLYLFNSYLKAYFIDIEF